MRSAEPFNLFPLRGRLHAGIFLYSIVTIQIKKASGGKVCHLESRLQMRFAPRSSGQITSAGNRKPLQSFFQCIVGVWAVYFGRIRSKKKTNKALNLISKQALLFPWKGLWVI